MSHTIKRTRAVARLLPVAVVTALWLAATAYAAAPGITGPIFNLTAQAAYINQPDGASIYSWGYGCASPPTGFLPTTISGAVCPAMQVPGPTLIVIDGQQVSVTLHNNLPAAAGNTSIIFPGFTVSTSGGVAGLLTQEAQPGGLVTYSFTATGPGTRAYYSGTQGDLQIEMGLFGVIIVLPNPANTANFPSCPARNPWVEPAGGTGPVQEPDFRLSTAAYYHPESCYDREYMFQFSEIDPGIHRAAELQSTKICPAGATSGCMDIDTEPYHPAYYLINGRSFPDSIDPNYATQYPHQPYNADPHIHPGEKLLVRIIGQGREQHPFHEHANHVRILAHDANLIISQGANPINGALAGPVLFTTTTTPGQAMDGIFYFTGRGLNFDMYAHMPGDGSVCVPDANGYYTASSGAPLTALNYYEWCADHLKPLEEHPFGNVASGGPITLPSPLILTNGAWYSASPYFGPDATTRAVGPTGTTPPSGTIANGPTAEAAYSYMWHSHNERELTTNNIFPGGMMMMLLVDPRAFLIDENK